MYKVTYDGDIDEIKFVAQFNANPDKFSDYLSRFDQPANLYMVRVTTKQLSKLCNKKVFTRSDCYLAEISSDIRKVLETNDYYLSEDILKENKIAYKPVPYSGISIKMTTSKTFQILKTGSNSFKTLFGSYELGAGAFLFCMRIDELEKNFDLINGWKSSILDMSNFFAEITHSDENFYLNQDMCKQIKEYSNLKIKQMIETSSDLQSKIFNGVGLYEEPYTAFYFYHGDKIQTLQTVPFLVTTGSGRSRGDYTIVLKPCVKELELA